MRKDPFQDFMEKSTSSTLRGEDIEAIRKAREESTKQEDIKRIQEQTRLKEEALRRKQREEGARVGDAKTPSKLNILSIINLKSTKEGFTFDGRTNDGSLVKDIFLSRDSFGEISKLVKRRQDLIKKQKRQKIIEFAIIYPGAVISLVYIIHTFMTYLPLLRGFFSADFGAFN